MPTLGTRVQSNQVQAVVYGPAKIGKTFGAGTFPRPNFIDFDAGIATLASPEFVKRYGWHPEIMYSDFTEGHTTALGIVDKADALDQASRYFDKCMKPGEREKFDTWIIDTGTFLAEASMNKALVLLGGSGFKGISSHTLAEGIEHGLIVPKLQDYGSERSMTEQFIRMVAAADKHFLFLCHDKEVRSDDGALQRIVPLLTGQSVDKVSAMFDDVWRVEKKKSVVNGVAVDQRVVRTQPSSAEKFMAGSRLGLPDGTLWEWPAIHAALEVNRLQRAALNQPKKE